MKGSEFAAAFGSKGQAIWEAAAVASAVNGDFLHWPFVAVPMTSPDGSVTGIVRVASDYFAVGEPDDFLYLPLSPLAAQAIADAHGLSLPTRAVVDAVWRGANLGRVAPQPMRNVWIGQGFNPDVRMVSMPGYLDHNRAVQQTLAGKANLLVAGTKKDVIVSRFTAPGKVCIYGWHQLDGTPIQPLSDVHGIGYADYSHGIRFVQNGCTVNGSPSTFGDVLASSALSSVFSGKEGPIPKPRYGPKPPGTFSPANFSTPEGAEAHLASAELRDEVLGAAPKVVLGAVAVGGAALLARRAMKRKAS